MRMTTWVKVLCVVSWTVMAAPAFAGQDPIADRAEIIKKVDWKTMKTIKIEFDEHSYEPDFITFKVGQPYKLILKNIGEKKHYFTAPAFYKSIATRKVQANAAGEIKADYFLALELMAKGGQLDLYFVPVKKGTYPVYCTIEDHRKDGMDGKLVIE